MSFLDIKENGTSPSGKTKRWNVNPALGGPRLGDIRWYAPWCKYVFQSELAIFDEVCLSEIADFLEKETRAHRNLIQIPNAHPENGIPDSEKE